MKKAFSILLVLLVVLSANVFANGSQESAEGKKDVFGLSIMTLGAEFFVDLQAQMETIFGEAGYDVRTVSAEMDVAKQVSDIENLVTQGAKGILVGPMDPNSLQDACITARESGTKIITFVPFENKEAYDVLVGVDEKQLGLGAAELASEWVDKKFSGAADKSIDTILVTYPANPTAMLRTEGLKTIADNPRVNVVENYEMGTSDPVDRVQEFMEMALAKYPDLKLVLVHDSSFAIAANEVLARTSGVTASEVGIFAIGSSEAAFNAVESSKNDNSMVRGLIDMEALAESAKAAWDAIESGNVPADKFILGSFSKVNADNVDDYLK